MFNARWKMLVGALVAAFILLQFAVLLPPFAHDNPDVTHTVQWDSPRTEELWNTACADCHSNETSWPWYSWVAPVSLLVGRDVQEGRDEFNVSTGENIEPHEMIEAIQEGEMPPAIYTVIHSDADLSDAEKDELIAGIQATFSVTGQSGELDDDGDEEGEATEVPGENGEESEDEDD